MDYSIFRNSTNESFSTYTTTNPLHFYNARVNDSEFYQKRMKEAIRKIKKAVHQESMELGVIEMVREFMKNKVYKYGSVKNDIRQEMDSILNVAERAEMKLLEHYDVAARTLECSKETVELEAKFTKTLNYIANFMDALEDDRP